MFIDRYDKGLIQEYGKYLKCMAFGADNLSKSDCSADASKDRSYSIDFTELGTFDVFKNGYIHQLRRIR